METYPLVTVFTLIYNTNPKYIIEAIESVRSNNYPHIQHIIIDDCSPDTIPKETVKGWIEKEKYPCEFYEHEVNYGLCKTLNHVIELSKGKYLFGCSDDLMLNNKIFSDVLLMEEDDSIGLIFSNAKIIDENSNCKGEYYMNSIVPANNAEILTLLEKSSFICAPSCCFRLKMFDDLGVFDETLYFEDWDIQLRIAHSFWQIKFNEDCQYYYRKHQNSLWNSFSFEMLIAIFKLFEKYALFKKSDSILYYIDYFRGLSFLEKYKTASYLKLCGRYNLMLFYLLCQIKFLRVIRFKLYKYLVVNN
jgi:GT2 family glycosyltransferase